MKSINSILAAISILLLTSCGFSNSSDKANIKRQDVLGSWTITAESKEKQDKNNSTGLTIKSFQLNSDSTAIVTYANSVETQRSGKWRWKAEKKLGNDSFGFSVNTDVVIYVNSRLALGLLLNKTDGKIKPNCRRSNL